MRNKIENSLQPCESKEQLIANSRQQLHHRYSQIRHEKVFQPPSFLYMTKEHHHSHQKASYDTLNGFKPKLETKPHRQFSSSAKKPRSKHAKLSKNNLDEKKVPMKINIMENIQLKRIRQEHALHLSIGAKQCKDESLFVHSSEEKVSPYARYPANCFPRKEQRLQRDRTGKGDYFTNLGMSKKSTMNQKLQQMHMKFKQIQSKNVLQMMTIMSIKQQKKSENGKHQYRRKRQFLISLSEKDKEKGQLRYKKRIFCEKQADLEVSSDKIYNRKINSFLCFLSKVNYSNNLPAARKVNLRDKFQQQRIKVYIGHGNNRCLLVALLKRRFWLEITPKINKDTKFIWTQNSYKDVHQLQTPSPPRKAEKQIKNRMSTEQGVKDEQLINPQTEISLQKQFYSAFISNRRIPLLQTLNPEPQPRESPEPNLKATPSKIMKARQLQNHHKLFINNVKAEKALKNFSHFKIVDTRISEENSQILNAITNHIPQNSFIGSKKALFYTMQHYYRQTKGIDPFTIIPKTYHFKNLDDLAYTSFLQNEKQNNDKAIWIVKPGECTNRGNGIYITRAADISRKLLKQEAHSNGQPKTTIVQKYITDPLLYNGRKFDIRHFMMITVINGCLKAYWYKEGYLRTSSQFFSLQNLSNNYIHLTNDAIQKNSQRYGKYELGNKLSYTQLQRYLDHNFSKQKINFKEQILTAMRDIAQDVVKANYMNLDRERKLNNFQIFGLDFMIDSKFKPWLIEINANPCLQTSCPLLSRLIPVMVQHSLRLGLDPLIMPPSHYPTHQRYYLADNFLQNMKYEIIFDELQEYPKQDGVALNYDFDFDEPEDEYQNEGTDIDLPQID